MFRKVLEHLRLVRRADGTNVAEPGTEIPSNVPLPKLENQEPEAQEPLPDKEEEPPTESLLLNLPLDIMLLIAKYLPPRDQLSLSLTTKGLRGVSEKPFWDWSGPKNSKCKHEIYKRLLPAQTESSASCPYCSAPLCPPTCSSALFLDYKSGVFYPASLYPIHSADLVPLDITLKGVKTSQFFKTSFSRDARTGPTRDINIFRRPMYTTIWCSHHRCPSDLLVSNFPKRKPSAGSSCFWQQYHDWWDRKWQLARQGPLGYRLRQPGHDIQQPRLLVGYRPKSSSFNPQNSPLNEEDLEPVYELPFYDSLCRHCCLPLPSMDGSYQPWYGITCDCVNYSVVRLSPRNYSRPPKPGCRTCGTVSVKFTVVEAFDQTTYLPGQSPSYGIFSKFFLVVASEMTLKHVPSSNGKLVQRLVPTKPVQADQALGIVRCRPVVLPRPDPKLRLQDLPIPILHQIVSEGILFDTIFAQDQRYISIIHHLLFLDTSSPADDPGRLETERCLKCTTSSNPIYVECTGCDYGFHLFLNFLWQLPVPSFM